MNDEYADHKITIAPDGLRIRHYYFPWGDKRIPSNALRSARRIDVGPLHGQLRIWGTANPRYWANLDFGRPRKKKGFLLDVGKRVKPFITPDDPNAFEAALRAHTGASIEDGTALII